MSGHRLGWACLILVAGTAVHGQTVIPILEGVAPDSVSGQLIAHWGYHNPGSTGVSNTAGSSTNFFLPGTPNRGQPSVFEPGRHCDVFQVPLPEGRSLIWVLGSVAAVADSTTASPGGPPFTYQGRLQRDGSPVTGLCDLRLTLWDEASAGAAVSRPHTLTAIEVVNGLFSVPVLAGPEAGGCAPLNGAPRWLEIEVRHPAGSGDYVTLAPRQPLTPVPYASYSYNTRGLQVDAWGNIRVGNGIGGDSLVVLSDAHFTRGLRADGIGIGTSASQQHVLDVNGTGRLLGLRLGNSATAGHVLTADGSGNGTWQALPPAPPVPPMYWTGTGDHIANTNPGNVGIGAPSPSYRLEVRSEELNVAGFLSPNEFGSVVAVASTAAGGRNYSLVSTGPGYGAGAGRFVIRDVMAASDRITIASDGAVGIGTGNPGAFRLAVSGEAAKPGGGSWATLSDSRLKQGIRPMEGTLEKLMALRGCEFEYRPEAVERKLGAGGRQIGLIAEDVERVFPDWVGKDEDGYRYVTERGTTALLVEGLRELRAEQDRKLAEKDAELAALRAELQELKAIVAGLAAKGSQ